MMTYPLENLSHLQEYAFFNLKITIFKDYRCEDLCLILLNIYLAQMEIFLNSHPRDEGLNIANIKFIF